MSPAENRPHIVYRRDSQLGEIFPNYKEAYAFWNTVHRPIADPFLIATLGRVIDPALEIVDVSE